MNNRSPVQDNKERRSRIMKAVRSKDTSPEKAIRRLAHAMGYRFRLHRRDLPGTPDIVFPKYLKVIFVHGCFWHGHHCARGSRRPQTNREYWQAKLDRNRARDYDNRVSLRKMGWDSLIIWECEINDDEALRGRIRSFLQDEAG